MAYRVIDPAGKAYALEAEITLIEEKNGMVKIETNIEPTKNNRKFIKEINEFWTIEGVKASTYGPFHIKHLQKVGVGDWPTLQVQATAHFIHVLQTTTMDGYYTGSRTANDFFNILSNKSGINIEPIDFKTAFGWEKFGLGVHNIKEFNRGLNNYGYTYKPVAPNIIELYDNIGRDVQYMIKNAFNSDDMKMEIDTSETFTYVEGYADFDEEGDFYETARLYDDYEHPTLFPLLGKWQAETYTNQKINQPETLKKYLKNIVDNSIKYTITASFHKIKNYPFAVPELGDRIRVQDDAINLDDTAEAVQIKTFYDKYGDVIDYEIDFGNLPIGQRVKASLESVQSQIDAIRSGRDPVNLGMLDANVAAVINSFKDSETEVKFGNYNGFQGLFLVDPNDPNKATALFSKGIGITNNGFAGGIDENMTITHDGINISTVYTGTLWLENFLGIVGKDSLFEINAEQLRMALASDPNQYMLMDINEGFTISRLPFTLKGKDGREVIQDGYMRGGRVANINPFKTAGYLGPNGGSPIYFDGMSWIWAGNTGRHIVNYIDDQYSGRFVDFRVAVGIRNSSASNSSKIKVEFETWDGTVVGAGEFSVVKGTDPLRQETIRIDLQALYNAVPDYRTIFLYAAVEVTGNQNVDAVFRINRGEHNG